MSIRWQLVILCLLVALLPAVPITLLVRTLIERSFDLGLSETVDRALGSGVIVSRLHWEELRASFEAEVEAIAPALETTAGDSAAVRLLGGRGASARGGVSAAGRLRFLLPKRTAEEGRMDRGARLPAELRPFAGRLALARLLGPKGRVRRRDGPEGAHAAFFETEDRSLQLAIIEVGSAAGPGSAPAGGALPVLLYAETDPGFLAHSGRLLKGRQMFAELRLAQEDLNRSFFYPFILIYGVILLLSLAVALVMARRLSAPVRRLARGAEVVAGGDWSHRIDVRAGGELGRLIGSFNDMVGRLEEQRRRLTDMEKMASWRELARFLAHEIKNPLLPIRLTVQELKDQYRGEDPRYLEIMTEAVRVVGDEVEHLQALVNEFSSFARMPGLTAECGSLAQMVEDTARLYPQLSVRTRATSRLPEFPFDQDQMRRVLINLLDNAVSLARDGMRGEVEIELARSGERAVLAVSDNGPGIPPGNLEKVFEPYFTTRAEGSGLGLAMVKNIILLHGGSIRVENREVGGVTFTIEIPLAGPPAGAEAEGGGA